MSKIGLSFFMPRRFKILASILLAIAIVPFARADWTDSSLPGIQSAAVAAGPKGIGVDIALRLAVIASNRSDSVAFVSLDTGTTTATLAVAARPLSVVVDSGRAFAYVLHEDGTISAIDLVAKTRSAEWKLNCGMCDVALSVDGKMLVLADAANSRVRLVSTDDGSVIRDLVMTASPAAVAFAQDGATLLVGTDTGVVLYSTDSWAQVGSILLPKAASTVAWWSSGKQALVMAEDRNLYFIDLSALKVIRAVAVSDEASAFAIKDNIAYIAHKNSNTVSTVNLSTQSYLGRYTLSGEPYGLAVDSAASRVLITLSKDDLLLRLDPAAAILTPVALLDDELGAIAVDDGSNQAVVASAQNAVYLVNLASKASRKVVLPARASALAIDPSNGQAIIGLDHKNGIRFLDLAADTLLSSSINLNDSPDAIAVDSSRGLAVVVVDKPDSIVFIDAKAKTILSSLAVPGNFKGVAIDKTQGRAYLLNQGKKTGEIIVLDLATRSAIGAIAVSAHAQAIVIDEALGLAVVAIELQNKLEVIDLNTQKVVQSFALARHPHALALNAVTDTVVVAAKDSDQIATLDLVTQTLTTPFAQLEKPQYLDVSARHNQALVSTAARGEIVFLQLPNPAPLLTEIQPPDSIPAKELALLAIGDKFIDSASKVVLDNQPLVTRWRDTQHLEADVPPNVLAAPGQYSVKVVTAGPGGGESKTLTFTVMNPAPVLTGIVPATLTANAQAQTITLTGSNFVGGSQVYFGAQVLSTTFVSATQLTAIVPANLITLSGQVPVTVFNPAPGGGTSAPFSVTVIGDRPVISGFSPTHGPVGSAITITGYNFDALNPGSNDVRFGGAKAVVVGATSAELHVIVPIQATTAAISVTTSKGTATSSAIFSIDALQDFALAISPSNIQVPVRGTGAALVTVSSAGISTYTRLVGVSVSGLPPGMTYTIDQSNASLKKGTVITFQTDGTLSSGTYTVVVHGVGDSDLQPVAHDQSLTLQVLDAATTTVTGRVLNAKDDSPIAGVRIRLGTQATVTDATGTYRFVNPTVVGDQVLLIDGGVLNTTEVEYPSAIPNPVMIVANQDNKPLTTYLQGIDTHKFTSITPGQETQVTTPDIPNYALRIPQGAVIYGWDGTPVDKVNVRTVPVDRLPIRPIPDGLNVRSVYLYYFFREGGGNPTQPIPVTMDNDIGAVPGQKVDLWYYDESPTPDPTSNQWRIMGKGTVSEDGKSIVSDPGVGIPKFCCGASFASVPNSPGDGPDGGDGCGPEDGNPVDLASGNGSVFNSRRFGISNLVPVNLSCRYRSTSMRIGPFGRGVSFPYDWFAEALSAESVRVTAPNGVQYMLSLQSDGFFRASDGRAGGLGMEVRPTPNGRTLRFKNGTEYDFDEPGRLVAVRDASGNQLDFTLDGLGYIQQIRDARWRLYKFATTNVLIGGNQYTLVTQITDPVGRSISFAYDGSARLTSMTDAAKQVTKYDYDGNGLLVKKTDARGAITEYRYDAAGRTVEEILPDGGHYQFAYTVVANTVTETRVTDPNGNVTTYRFNGQGYEVRRTDALGRVFSKDVDFGTNQVLSETDPVGRVTRYTYDSHGNRTSTTDAMGNITQIEYDQQWNKPTRITNALGYITRLTYDGQGRLATVTDPEGETFSFFYTAQGQLASTSDPFGHASRFIYDDQGNLSLATDAVGRSIQNYYDLLNRRTETIQPGNQISHYEYDDLDRLIKVIDALGNVVSYAYDENDSLLSTTGPNGTAIETNAYDLRNRIVQRTDALGLSSRYQYDGDGNLIQATDRKGQVISIGYDALNRPSHIVYADGRTIDYAYDLAGDLVRVSDSVAGETLYTYDELHRMTSEVTDRGTVSYAYDALGRIVERRLNDGDPTNYTYDRANRVKTIAYRGKIVTNNYDQAGRLITRVLANGITEQLEWNDTNQLLTMTYKKTDGTAIDRINYTYDQNGNVTARNRATIASVPETAFTAAYDAANRMITYNGQPLTYDDNGNLLTRQTAQGVVTYTWDGQNRLTGINGPNGNASFKYDYLGRRIEKTINGETVAFLYDGAQAVAELQGSSIGATYLTGLQIDEVLARFTVQADRTLLADALGSVIATTDDAQSTQAVYGYSAFGEAIEVGENGNPIQYTGRESDGTGLYFYRARYYDPQLKRFIASDPIGLDGGLNTYSYVHANPLAWGDPMGLCEMGDTPCQNAMRSAGIPEPGPEEPSSSTLNPCEMKWLNDHYGMVGGFITDTFNLQQYLPSSPTLGESWKTAAEVGTEKAITTRGVGSIGSAYSIEWARIWGGVSSSTLEVVGSGFTTFATTAKKLAERHCSCNGGMGEPTN